MERKRVLFFIPTLGHGGAEKVLVNLVNNLDADKFDITVQTVFDEGVNKDFLNRGIRYIYTYKKLIRGFSHFFKILSPRTLHNIMIKENYDIEVAFLEGVSTRIISGCPNQNTTLIAWVHCTMHDEAEASIGFRDIQETKKCYSKFDKIVCVSRAVENEFNKIFKKDSCTTYIYNVNESEWIRECARKSEVTVSTEEFNICAVGKIIDVKGFDRLARIQKKLINQNYNTHVYILGVGDKQKEIEEYIQAENFLSKWTFLGYKKNPYAWVASCDLFVCSSRSEGLSTAVTEALLIGVPVITTDVSGMRELLGDNEYGLIVKNDEDALFEGICKLIDNPQLLCMYKEKSSVRGDDFTKDKIILDVEKLLNELKG